MNIKSLFGIVSFAKRFKSFYRRVFPVYHLPYFLWEVLIQNIFHLNCHKYVSDKYEQCVCIQSSSSFAEKFPINKINPIKNQIKTSPSIEITSVAENFSLNQIKPSSPHRVFLLLDMRSTP